MNYLAKEIAELLDRDPITASQIKEYVKEDRLRELLNLPSYERPERDEVALQIFAEDALDCVVSEFKLSQVISAYKSRGGILN